MPFATPVIPLFVALVIAGCGGGGGGSVAPPPGGELIALERAFPALSFDQPVALVQVPGDTSRWFVVEQGGTIRVFANVAAPVSSAMFIDISDRVGDSGGERGLFGVAFDPDFGTNGRAYLSYTRSAPSLTSYVSRFTSNDGGLTLDAASEVVLLTLPQPFSNHNGGHIAFGPDDLLYVAFGDGGSGDDPGNRAQDTTNLFGTIIRIDVTALPYTIPPGNPFAGNPRCPTGSSTIDCPEIYAYGLRNPWRFSFDRNTGELWAADVGQGAWEEVDRIVAGGNYGWRIREGAHCNIPASGCTTVGLIDPVSEYDHDLGQSVTGGYVYRGSAITALRGDYLFGDFVTGVILRAVDGAGPPEVLFDSGLTPSSFGEDAAGELFVVSYSDGALYRVVAAP